MRALVLAALLLAAPSLAGCMDPSEAATEEPADAIRPSAADAGAIAGPAPAAPSQPYTVTAREAAPAEGSGEPAEGVGETTTTAFPLRLETNPARAPERLEVKGTYNATECSYLGNLNPTMPSWRHIDLSALFEPGDVYAYSLNLTWTNTDQSWGDVHLFYGIGGKNGYNEGSTARERGPLSAHFTGQGYRLDDDDPAWAAVACWYGQVTTPLDYTLTVEITFAQDAVPAETAIAVVVPPDATRLLVAGVPVDPARGVLSHYRVFGPDDGLLCECALSSADQASALRLPGPGEYVVLVDHTDNGFVSLALDAPPTRELRALNVEWSLIPLLRAEGGAVDEVVELEIPTVPLGLYMSAAPAGRETGAALGKGIEVHVENARGLVVSVRWEGFASYRLVTPSSWHQMWFPMPLPGDWAYEIDHHAFEAGAHRATVKAEALRGEVALGYITYQR